MVTIVHFYMFIMKIDCHYVVIKRKLCVPEVTHASSDMSKFKKNSMFPQNSNSSTAHIMTEDFAQKDWNVDFTFHFSTWESICLQTNTIRYVQTISQDSVHMALNVSKSIFKVFLLMKIQA